MVGPESAHNEKPFGKAGWPGRSWGLGGAGRVGVVWGRG
jgi:hypothetical protein